VRNGVFSFEARSGETAMIPGLTLRPATLADLDAIMAIERAPGFEQLVGCSPEPEHRAMMASADYAYFIGAAADGAAAAFAILGDFADPHDNLYLKRIAVARPDEGVGGAFLGLVVAWVFAHTATHRFWLSCFTDNARAQRVYAKLGFTRDGVLRQAYRAPDGSRRDLTMMALTRPEWAARAGGADAAPIARGPATRTAAPGE
jgi:RimJ/RimL family protein N-acetyltransferase